MSNWCDAIYEGEDNGANPFAIQRPARNDELAIWLRCGGNLSDFATRDRAENIQDVGVVISQPGALK